VQGGSLDHFLASAACTPLPMSYIDQNVFAQCDPEDPIGLDINMNGLAFAMSRMQQNFGAAQFRPILKIVFVP